MTLDKISPYLVAATIATEDQSFTAHPGFDWLAIVRAFWQNWQERRDGLGGVDDHPAGGAKFAAGSRRARRTHILRKVREALLAAEITRRYSKDTSLSFT